MVSLVSRLPVRTLTNDCVATCVLGTVSVFQRSFDQASMLTDCLQLFTLAYYAVGIIGELYARFVL